MIGWLPESRQEEVQVAKQMSDCVLKNNLYSLYPLTFAIGINEDSIQFLASLDVDKKLIKSEEYHLPAECKFAVNLIRRKQATKSFCEMSWSNASGVFKELWIFDEGRVIHHEFTQIQ